MAEAAAPLVADLGEARSEIARLNKVIRVLMDRAERSTSGQSSDYSLFQATVMLEEQVRRRTAELQVALRENERINGALRDQAEAEQRVLRESEQQLQALLQNCSDMVTVVARDATVLYQAGAVRAVLGREPDDLKGANLAGWVENADLARLHELCETRDTAVAELHLRHVDGRLRTCEVIAADVSGHPSWDGVLLNIRDVTERQKLELELRLAQKLESIGQLAAGVAHEINTPIQFIRDSVTFLKEGVDGLLALTSTYHELLHGTEAIDRAERQRRAVCAEHDADLDYLTARVPPAFERALDGIDRVAAIVSAMRQFAHTSGQRALIDVNEGLQTTLIVARNEYKYVADVELDLRQIPPVVANAGDLNQVFLNLIVNASHAISDVVAHTEQRGRLVIQTRVEADQAVIAITDTGTGIPLEIADRIFDPFFTTKEVGRGTGQGLAIARTIVDREGGALTFATQPGKGTTFTIRLPLADPQSLITGGSSVADGRFAA